MDKLTHDKDPADMTAVELQHLCYQLRDQRDKLVRTMSLILSSLEFEEHMYGKVDPRRSTIDFPKAIKMARNAIAQVKGGDCTT